jgi:hypothetical protein
METAAMSEQSSANSLNAARPVELRRYIVIGIFALSALWGVVQSLSENALVTFLGTVLFAMLTTAWCVADSRRRGRPLLSIVQMIMFFTWFISVPIYLIASRGWRGVGYALVNAVGMTITMWIAAALTLFCAYGAAAFSTPVQ